MGAFVLVHGAGGSPWEWHLVARRLAAAGDAVVAVDLPVDDPAADLAAHVAVVRDGLARAGAVAPRGPVVVAAHSYGAWFATAAVGAADADRLVLVAPMLPRPGERAAAWWDAVHAGAGPRGLRPWREEASAEHATGLTGRLAAEAHRRRRHQAATTVHEPWPGAAWPDVATTVVLGTRDPFLTAPVLRRAARDRVPDAHVVELDAGHLVPLEVPGPLAALLRAEAAAVAAGDGRPTPRRASHQPSASSRSTTRPT